MCVTFQPFRMGAAIVGFSVALLLTGCGDNTTSSDNTTPKTPDTTHATAGDATAEIFVKDAANANMAEVQLGQLAESRATSADVKQFAQHMLDDHSKNLEQVKQLAAKKNITLPSAPGSEEQSAKAKLEKLNGVDFDMAYVKMMVDDHTKVVSEFERSANSITEADVKSYAEQTLPALRNHLKMARDLNDRIKASNSQASEKPGEAPVQTTKEPETQQAR